MRPGVTGWGNLCAKVTGDVPQQTIEPPMADTYRAWLRGIGNWQGISVIDLRTADGTGKRLQLAGLKTLGEIDLRTGAELLKLPGLGIGVVKKVRGLIRTYKAVERRRRSSVSPVRLRVPRTFG